MAYGSALLTENPCPTDRDLRAAEQSGSKLAAELGHELRPNLWHWPDLAPREFKWLPGPKNRPPNPRAVTIATAPFTLGPHPELCKRLLLK